MSQPKPRIHPVPPAMLEKHRAVEALLHELPGLWCSAEDIAECLGAATQGVAKIAVNLAETGAVERRTVYWRSSRSRPRERLEFRVSAASTGWERYPPWLEPDLHPVDQSRCRRVTGAATFSQENEPMNEAEYRALPRNIREKFNDLSDEQFADHPSVVAARAAVESAESKHRKACEEASNLRQRKVAVETIGARALAQLRELHKQRVQHLVDALLIEGTDTNLQFDSQMRDDTERLALTAEAVPVALEQADEQLISVNRRIRMAASSVQEATEQLRGVLDRLKLQAAQA